MDILTSPEEAITSDFKETSITAHHKIVSFKKTYGNSDAQQLVYYHPGVGTGGFWDRLIGGATGKGIDANIKDAYRYIAENYQSGDRLFLFGFSRGAYTVRSLVGLIRKGGILPKDSLKQCDELYELYRTDPTVDSEKAKEFRIKYKCDIAEVHFLGVFDTVGSLGIPDDIFDDSKKYNFHDTTLSKIVKHAYHALATDEKRFDFQPTLWQAKKTTISEQRWFIGGHSDIGGGYEENALSHISLQWMLSRAIFRGLLCPPDYHPNNNPTDDYLGELHDASKKFPFRFFRPTVLRPICLFSSDEKIHSTVFRRLNDEDKKAKSKYRPQNIVCDKDKAYLYEDAQPIMHPYSRI